MLYTVKTIRNNTQKEPKNPLDMVFFVIKKKVYKRAVDRNRVKRRARKAFMDAVKGVIGESILKNSPLQTFSINKKIIFFLEHDMIQESYATIVLQMKNDITQLLTKHS